MNYPSLITSSRLLLQPLEMQDTAFVRELLNTEGWLNFIGNRNIATDEDAQAYINRITGSPHIHYWKVSLANTAQTIGIVTFIERDHLPHPDIGFAFLPRYFGKGYAREATRAVIETMRKENKIEGLVAIVLPHNTSSIRLLTALDFRFEKDIEEDGTKLHLYGLTINPEEA